MRAKTQNTFSLVPTPSPLDSALHSEHDIAKHRRLYCGHYNECLSRSVREGWAGFSCLNCPLKDLAVTGLTSEPFAHQRRAEDSA